MKEQVNHPKHYNSHPNGIECIDIIRHYTCDIANALKYLWRAGLKAELGKDDADKEIEDLKKALWYIEDYRKNERQNFREEVMSKSMKSIVSKETGYSIAQIANGYENNISKALSILLQVGFVRKGNIRSVLRWDRALQFCTELIQDRILDIEMQLTNKKLQSTVDVINGYAVEGEDYVFKPGNVREDEPDKYDPLNMMIIYGRAYCLTDEVRKKDNGALYSPCDNCDLRNECLSDDGTQPTKNLCRLHYANDQQYYREVGHCKYCLNYGTIEVVDVHKELELELKRLEEELNTEG